MGVPPACWGTEGVTGAAGVAGAWAAAAWAAWAAAACPAPKPPPAGGAAGVPAAGPVLPGCAPCCGVRGERVRKVMVPSEGRSSAPGPAGRPLPLPGVPPVPSAAGRTGPVGRRNTTVPPDAGGCGLPESAGGIVAVPSVREERPSGWTTGSAGSDACGTRGSAALGGDPQATRRSRSPPKPVCRERSAPHAAAGSGRVPCWASAGLTCREPPDGCGSSSKKCGPVSSAGTGAWAGTDAGWEPGGGASGTPSDGAGRLVPGTQAAPFQYRTYPGMEGSG